MAQVNWEGGAPAVAQKNTITPSGVIDVGDTFTITINGKDVTFTATAGTVANVTAGLYALLSAATAPAEFREITWADATTAVTGTAKTAGQPFTLTATSVGATLTDVVTIANQSPNDWANAKNWSTGAVPVSTDDVAIENSAVDILYGLNQSAVTLTSLTIAKSFTGKIGLPKRAAGGYDEYRDDYLRISATTITIGSGTGAGSGRIKLNVGTAQTTITQYDSGRSAEAGLPAVIWKGTHASNAATILAGEFGAAVFGGETATLATLHAGGGTVRTGSGVTLTTVNHAGTGTLEINSNSTTVHYHPGAGKLTIRGAATVTTLNANGSECSYESTGTITTLNVGSGGYVNFDARLGARTVTNCTVWRGGKIRDRQKQVTWTNPISVAGATIKEVDLDFGIGRTYAVAG